MPLFNSEFGRLSRGMGYWFRGTTYFLKRPRLWLYILWPLLINILITALLAGFLFSWMDNVLPDIHWVGVEGLWYHPGTWWQGIVACFKFLGNSLIWALTVLLVLVSWVVGFVILASIVGSPFYDKLAGAIEREQGRGTEERPFTLRTDIFLPVTYAVKMSVFEIGLALLLLPLHWIPLVGTVLYLLGVSFPLACALIAYTFERRLIPFRAQIRFAWANRYDYMGYGLVAMLSMMPFGLAVLTFPLSVCGGVLLFVEQYKEDSGIRNQDSE